MPDTRLLRCVPPNRLTVAIVRFNKRLELQVSDWKTRYLVRLLRNAAPINIWCGTTLHKTNTHTVPGVANPTDCSPNHSPRLYWLTLVAYTRGPSLLKPLAPTGMR